MLYQDGTVSILHFQAYRQCEPKLPRHENIRQASNQAVIILIPTYKTLRLQSTNSISSSRQRAHQHIGKILFAKEST